MVRGTRGGGNPDRPHETGGARRIQRGRGPRWRLPDGAVYVGRPTAWGNPFRVSRSSDHHGLPGSWFVLDEAGTTYHPDEDSERAARQLTVDLYARVLHDPADARLSSRRAREELAGHDLVCWCPLAEPCHVDVLLAVANAAAPVGEDLAEQPSTGLTDGSLG